MIFTKIYNDFIAILVRVCIIKYKKRTKHVFLNRFFNESMLNESYSAKINNLNFHPLVTRYCAPHFQVSENSHIVQFESKQSNIFNAEFSFKFSSLKVK